MNRVRRQRRLNFAPGSRFLYSNSNFLLLGRIAEHLSGEPLPGFLERRIFAPLGMSDTRMVEDPYEAVPRLATGSKGLRPVMPDELGEQLSLL